MTDEKIKIIIETNAEQASDSLGKLSGSLKESGAQSENLKVKMRELKEQLYSLEIGSEEYKNVLAELAQAQHDFKDINEEVAASSGELDTVFSNLQQATTGIASGFSAVNAIFTMFGSESEDLQKSMVKLQQGIALVQGLKGFEGIGKTLKATGVSIKSFISNNTALNASLKVTKAETVGVAAAEGAAATATNVFSKSLKGLKTALVSTGIGALVVAIGVLIANFDKLFDKTERQTSANKALADSKYALKWATEQLGQAFEEQDAELARQAKLMAAEGKTQTEILDKQIELVNEQIVSNKQLGETYAELKDRFEEYGGFVNLTYAEQKALTDAGIESLEDLNGEIGKNEAQYQKLYSKLLDLENDKKVESVKAEKTIREELKKTAEESKKAAEESKRAAKAIKDEYIKAIRAITEEFDKFQKGLTGVFDAGGTLRSISDSFNIFSKSIDEAGKDVITKFTDLAKAGELEKAFEEYGDEYAEYLGMLFSEGIEYYEKAYKVFVEESNKLAEQLSEGKIKQNDFVMAVNEMAGELKKIDQVFNSIKGIDVGGFFDKVNFPEQILNLGDIFDAYVPVNALTKGFKEIENQYTNSLNALKKIYDDGLIDSGEFYVRYLKLFYDFKGDMESEKLNLDTLIETIPSGQQQSEAFRNFLETYNKSVVEFSSKITKAVTDEAAKTIEEVFSIEEGKITAEYERLVTVMEGVYAKDSGPANLFEGFYGKSLSQWYDAELEYVNQVYDYQVTYNEKEIELLNQKMQAASGNLEMQKQIQAEISSIEMQNTLIREEQAREQIRIEKEKWDKIRDISVAGANSTSNILGSLSSLYGEFAEDAKERYGEDSVEYMNYKKKQANAQKATAVIDMLTGIVAAISGAMSLGPIAGPIVGAAESAALAIACAAQIASIDREMRNLGASGGGGSTPNTSAVTGTSSVMYGNFMQSDTESYLQTQTAQDQRVYVVQGDITESQEEHRATVTNATF